MMPSRFERWGLWLVVRVVFFLVTPLQIWRWLWHALPCSLAEYMAFEWDSTGIDMSNALAGSTYGPVRTAMLIPWVFGREFRSEHWREIQRKHLRQGHR